MKRIGIGAVVVLLLLPVNDSVWAEPVTKPYTFTSGTPARAEEVNANFDNLYDAVNAMEVQKQAAHTGAIYRWAVFDTYHNNSSWMMGNRSDVFGGVNPSNWTDNRYRADHMSADKEVLRTLFTLKGYGGTNALIKSEVFFQYSSTNGKVVTALFRILNTTQNDIVWTPYFYYTCYSTWGEVASIAVNGVNAWDSGSDNCGSNCYSSVELTLPANRTSTVIFVSTSGIATPTGAASTYVRLLSLAIYNNSLDLPEGLQFVDDLDTATGGWEQ